MSKKQSNQGPSFPKPAPPPAPPAPENMSMGYGYDLPEWVINSIAFIITISLMTAYLSVFILPYVKWE